jgi:hypothetical protein
MTSFGLVAGWSLRDAAAKGAEIERSNLQSSLC